MSRRRIAKPHMGAGWSRTRGVRRPAVAPGCGRQAARCLGFWLAPAAAALCLGCGLRAPYRLELQGAPDRATRRLAREMVPVAVYEPQASPAALQRVLKQDGDLLTRALRAQGRYDATVAIERIPAPRRGRPRIRVTLADLEPYQVGEVTLRLPPNWPADLTPTQHLAGATAAFDIILETQRELLAQLHAHGFPLATLNERILTPDPARRTLTVVFDLSPGPAARFGPLTLTGLRRLKPQTIHRLVPWQTGDPYRPADVQTLQERLLQSGWFSQIELAPGDALDPGGLLPLTLNLRERKPREIRAGLGYQSDRGPEARLIWTHRNLAGRGENLELMGQVNGEGYETAVTLRIPQAPRPNQNLAASLRVSQEDTDAYHALARRTLLRLERTLSRRWRVAPGVAIRSTDVRDSRRRDSFWLLSTPLDLTWSTRDQLLDPTRGQHLTLHVQPFLDLEGESATFSRQELTARAYWTPWRDRRLTLAQRVSLGTIVGAGAFAIPADERFYAGGARSIRGYPHQSVGPRDEGQPSGGRARLESATEARLRLGANLGLVLFLDAGNAWQDTLPDWDEELRLAAGLGLRYFTAVGPVRADLAYPLNPAAEVSARLQLYVSIGQAF